GRTARAAAYRWRADGQDATLIEDSEIIPLPGDSSHRWLSPGPEEQLNLDYIVSGFLFPLSPRQLKRNGLADRVDLDRIESMCAIDDPSAPLEARVRSYLDANCAACHRPGGPSRGAFDARF